MRISPIVHCLTASIAITFLIAVMVSLSPIRWDIKAFGPVLPQVEAPGLEANSNVLFVSADNEWENGHFAQYGLDMVTFPKGKFQWMIFKEGDRGVYTWPTNWMIDQAGRLYRSGSDQVWPSTADAPDDLKQFIKFGQVVVRTTNTKVKLLERWPELTEAMILTMKAGTSRFIEIPRVRITLAQCLRLFLLVFIFVVPMVFGGWIVKEDHYEVRKLLNAALVFPGVLVLHTALVYLLGNITSSGISTALLVELISAIGLLGFMCRGFSNNSGVRELKPEDGNRRPLHRWLLAAAALIFVSSSMLRLDFDGDMLTQYLPVARYHYLEGRHDPRALISRYGVMTQATYPPGFPISISSLMWVSEVNKDAVGFNYPTNLMVFLYRLLLTALHLSFLVALGALLNCLGNGKHGFNWLLPLVAISFLLPLFLGQPGAAEVYLIPLVGFSIVAVYAGAQLNQSAYIHLGLFIGAAMVFVKKEGILIFCLIVLTWYVAAKFRSGRFSLRETAGHLATAIIGLSPFLIWRLKLGEIARSEYFFYQRPSLSRLMANWALLGKIVEKATKILLANNYWVILFLLLPLIIVYSCSSRWLWKDQVIPLGIALYATAMTCVFVFSQHPGGPIEQMDVSYDRLMATPVLAAILYGAKSLFESKLMRPGTLNL